MDYDVAAEFDRASEGPITVDITTVGRRTSEPRRIEIWIVTVDGRIVIGGTPGDRDWYANLLSDPTLTIHLKDSVVADVPARATAVTEMGRRTEIWNHRSTAWYRRQSSVEDLIARAPTVEVALVNGL